MVTSFFFDKHFPEWKFQGGGGSIKRKKRKCPLWGVDIFWNYTYCTVL